MSQTNNTVRPDQHQRRCRDCGRELVNFCRCICDVQLDPPSEAIFDGDYICHGGRKTLNLPPDYND